MENKAGAGGANTSEGMLANFFNSLLSKKSGAAGTPRPGFFTIFMSWLFWVLGNFNQDKNVDGV